MRCPTIDELPPPPPGRTGWPWTEESAQLPEIMPDGTPWPKISIVTPSYNQGQFIEETIRSVLLQGYPNLEYMVIDGGSTDESVEIIKRYEPWLAYWVSEEDRGQSHAINKGFERATGEIIAWLNSDDTYEPESVQKIIRFLTCHPNLGMVYGSIQVINQQSEVVRTITPPEFCRDALIRRNFIPQPSVFMSAEAIRKAGLLDENLNFAMDEDYWYRLSLEFNIERIDDLIADFRLHCESKSMNERQAFIDEHLVVYDKLFQHPAIDQSLLSAKKQFYAQAYFDRGYIYKRRGEFAQMRRAWLRAGRLFPQAFLKRNLLFSFFLSLIPRFARSVIQGSCMRIWKWFIPSESI